MTNLPRRRAIVDGLHVRFESRNANRPHGKPQPRFKMRYRTIADAIAAKAAWEERGKILWPDDLKAPKATPARETPARRYRETVQGEMRV